MEQERIDSIKDIETLARSAVRLDPQSSLQPRFNNAGTRNAEAVWPGAIALLERPASSVRVTTASTL